MPAEPLKFKLTPVEVPLGPGYSGARSPLEFELVEVRAPVMPAHFSEKVARMIEKAFEQHGRGSWIRTEMWVKNNYGEWYDYLDEESPR